MPEQVIAENGQDVQPQIVSVNTRGGSSAGIVGRLVFAMLVLAILVVGAVYGVNRYRATRAEEEKNRTAQIQKTDKRTGGQPGRRIFSTDPPPAPKNAAATPSIEPMKSGSRCNDGSPGLTPNGADGTPITTIDGRQIRVCGDGQVLLTPVATLSPTPPATAPVAGVAATTAPPSRTSRYSGDVLVPSREGAATAPTVPAAEPNAAAASADEGTQAMQREAIPASQSPSGASGASLPLPPSSPPSIVRATMLGDRDLILPQDRSIDCNLSMRLVSEISGRAVCVLPSYVYGDSGRVVLAEPGSVVSGEYTAVMAQGQRRLLVIWTRLKTPRGVVIDLNSPAADALGTAGLDGVVDNRWPERIGAAFLLSVVQDAIGYETAKAASGGGTGSGTAGIAVFQHSTDTGSHMADKVLESTINIKPTIYKQPGDRATIMVARDLDFGGVYALRRK
jgi:type IV secretion system protein VirB10